MILSERHIRPIAVGSMLTEGLVSILALIAAASLFPFDYFQINVPVDKFQELIPQLHAMGFTESDIEVLSAEVGENIKGRTGGAVSLAVGMAQIFSAIPGLTRLMSYWYHFAIMFEALFILTTVDAGTRIARFILQEGLGKFYRPLGRTNWLPGNIGASLIVVVLWGYFIYTGTVATIWPMFGTANQLLASIALVIGTSYIINLGKVKYAWTTLVPLIFLGITTLTAGFKNIMNIYLPQVMSESLYLQGIINLALTAVIMTSLVVIFANAVPRWYTAMKGINKIQVNR
jgi:carbon starvation protein